MFRSLSHLLAALFTDRAGFHRRWAEWNASTPADELAGRWEGDWTSESNGHHGALKCLLTPKAGGNYEAFFHAVYAKFLTVCYRVELQVEGDGDKFKLAGEADLGALSGGLYQYHGEAGAGSFRCAYRCKYDHGVFRLERSRR